MPDPIPGTLSEWVEIEPNRWERTGHPESGIITVTPPLTFEEYYYQRQEETIDSGGSGSMVEQDPVTREEFDALEARVAALESK